MPEPNGDVQVGQQAAPEGSDGLFDSLRGMLAPQRPRTAEGLVRFDSDSDEEPAVATTRSRVNTPADGPVADDATLESDEDTDEAAQSDDEAATPVAVSSTPEGEQAGADGEAAPGQPAEQPAGGDVSRKQKGSLITQREQERDEWKLKAETLERERDEWKSKAEAAPAPAPVAVDDTPARQAVLSFMGLGPEYDESGKPIGDPKFPELDKKAKGRGFDYEDEQREYSELSQRQAMVGTIYQVATRVALDNIAPQLEDADLGITADDVRAAGNVANWKRLYADKMQARYSSQASLVQSEKDAAVAAVRDEYEAKLKEARDKLAAAERQIQEQAASHTSRFARVQTLRTPVSGGRSVGATQPAAQPGRYRTMESLMNDLASGLQEGAERAATSPR